jgi:hypothetical protein
MIQKVMVLSATWNRGKAFCACNNLLEPVKENNVVTFEIDGTQGLPSEVQVLRNNQGRDFFKTVCSLKSSDFASSISTQGVSNFVLDQ